MSLPMPERVPEPGFYYHYKHSPGSPLRSYAYEVLGVGFHTEADTNPTANNCRPGEEHFVIYRSLYRSASVYRASEDRGVPCFDVRPLNMWMDVVTVGNHAQPRFRRITDPEVVAELARVRDEMYPK